MESDFNRRRLAVCILVAVVIALVIFTVAHRRPWESATTRAYRLCGECGLTAGEVDELVDSGRHSTLNREQRAELFYSRYETPDRQRYEKLAPLRSHYSG